MRFIAVIMGLVFFSVLGFAGSFAIHEIGLGYLGVAIYVSGLATAWLGARLRSEAERFADWVFNRDD